MLNNFIKYSSIYLVSIKILYKFKVKESLNLLKINNLNLNDLITLSNISTIEALAKSFAIKVLVIKRAVADRVSLRKSSINVVSTAINIFLAKLDSYYSQYIII